MVRSRKELEILLSRAPYFISPSITLEQYLCDSSVASELLWMAHMYEDIEGRSVVDLGCGTGMLSYGALLLGAKDVICVDIDIEALNIAKVFLVDEGFNNIHFVNADVNFLDIRNIDTVIMNPPFGVYRKGLDIVFLKKALEFKPKAVYTIHKYNPESYILIYRTVQNEGYTIRNMLVRFMSIGAIYLKHRKRIHRFRVSVYAISRYRGIDI
ncbi:MAG: METTL5 family protein [Ignisphaera sp.]